MARQLPPLRGGLDLMPSPVPDRPGLLIRDPFRYSEAVLIIPPPLVPLLAHFNGQRTDLDLREALVRLTGQIDVSPILNGLVTTLGDQGFLENETFDRLRNERHRAFVDAPRREAAHSGSAYPEGAEDLRPMLDSLLAGAPEVEPAHAGEELIGIAAPHVSFEGGRDAYRAAYGRLAPGMADRTFVVVGTSHYGESASFGLTRKPFRTPLGETSIDLDRVNHLAAEGGPNARMEDYCHAVEHSIEFQVVLLQHVFGPGVRIVPLLCGPLPRGPAEDSRPEEEPAVATFLEALRGLGRQGRGRLFWVLGVDLAHIGRRYGDPFSAQIGQARMKAVAEEDLDRLGRVTDCDAAGFWGSVTRSGEDKLRWCGASPLYVFLRAVAPAHGELLDYRQWNIDEASVVSCAGLAFSGRG